jgi:hypothetical protein
MSGWVKVRGRDIINAIRAANVPSDGMVNNESLWVPSWVKEAIDLYYKNNGFADLKLHEFLSKVNPNPR